MQAGSIISIVGHTAVLLYAVVSFSGHSFEMPPQDSLPVDLVSLKDFSQITKGEKDAPKPKPKPEKPKPLVEKIDQPKPAENTKPKVAEKKEEIKTASAAPPEPPAKPDKIAEKLKKPDEKPVEAKATPKPLPPRKPQPQPKKQRQFDPHKIAALLDKRDPQRHAAAGAELNDTPTLGSVKGMAAMLSQSELDALRARISQCWSPPVGAEDTPNLYVVLRVLFKRDGSVAREPVPVEGSASKFGPALAESAKRALLRCQPFTMLKPEHYDQWKDIEIKFDLHEMLGG
jgi:colicin import membrane protein